MASEQQSLPVVRPHAQEVNFINTQMCKYISALISDLNVKLCTINISLINFIF